MKLVDLITVKQALNKSDNQHDSLIDLLIEGVSEQIEKLLNRKLLYGHYTDVIYLPMKTSYQVKSYPIDNTQPFSIQLDGITLTEGIDYEVDWEYGIIKMKYVPVGDKMTIDYYGGYKEISGVVFVPAPIRQAVLLQVIYEFQRRKEAGVVSMSMSGQGSFAYREGLSLLRGVKELVLPYRRMP